MSFAPIGFKSPSPSDTSRESLTTSSRKNLEKLFNFYSKKKPEFRNLSEELQLVEHYLNTRSNPEPLFVDPFDPTRRIRILNLAARLGSVDALTLLTEASRGHFNRKDREFFANTYRRFTELGDLALELDSIATQGQTDPAIFDAAQSDGLHNFTYLLKLECKHNPTIPPHSMPPTARPLLSDLILSEIDPKIPPELQQSRNYPEKINLTLKYFGVHALDARDSSGISARDLVASLELKEPLSEILRPWIKAPK
jgi:hypothetical protein